MATLGSYEAIFTLKDKISKSLGNISKNMEKFDGQLKGTSVQMERFQKKTENISKLGNKLKGIGQGLTVGVTLPVIAMGGAMVKAAADIESMQQQLSTMLGSSEKGAKMFDEIKTMAAKTPFETKDLMAATNTMLGFGIAQEKVLPLMSQLGDISGGNAERFQSLALAFSQVSSAGKLQGQDLLQMINAGFNPLESIAKRTGKSVGYWKEQMSKGKVTVQMVEQAMKDATSEGGRFFNMMEKQSKTALGQWSTFQDSLNMLLADFGKIILPTAIKGLNKLSETLEWLNSLSPGTKKTILVIGGIAAVIGPLLMILGGLASVIVSVNAAMAVLDANPIVLTIAAWTAAIVVVIAVIVLLIKNWDKVKAAVIRVGQAIAGVWSSLVEKFKGWISTLMGWVDKLLEKLGFLSYFIPGLGQIKLAKDVAGAIGNRTNNDNRQWNSNDNRSNFGNTYQTVNNYNSMFPLANAQNVI